MNNRENIFTDLKDTILSMFKYSDELKHNPIFAQRWRDKAGRVIAAINALNVDDRKWMDAKYLEWYKQEVSVFARDTINKLKREVFLT